MMNKNLYIFNRDIVGCYLNIMNNCIIPVLTERELMVLNHRFIFNSLDAENGKSRFGNYTLKYIAKKLGVTRERIGQIESKSLRKLCRYKPMIKEFEKAGYYWLDHGVPIFFEKKMQSTVFSCEKVESL